MDTDPHVSKNRLCQSNQSLFPKEHQETVSEEFVLYASVCPTKLFGYTPPPRGFMLVIGFIQTLGSFLLLLPFTAFHPWMYLVFCVMMTLSIYSHSVLGNSGKVTIASSILLACIVLYKTGPIAWLIKLLHWTKNRLYDYIFGIVHSCWL